MGHADVTHHSPGEAGRHHDLEARHTNQLPICWEPVRRGAVDHQGPRCAVVRAINIVLLRRIIHLGDMDPIISGFASMGFLNCGGAIDSTHIPIQATRHHSISTARDTF